MLENVIAIADKLSEVCDWGSYHERDSRQRRERVAKEYGLEFLGSGISRAAFRIGNHVIKLGGRGYNETEHKVWKRCRLSPAAELLVATLHISANGLAVVQDYGGVTLDKHEELTGENKYDKAREVADKINEALKETGVRWCDLHTGNIGSTGKVFDYGHFLGV